MDRTLEEIAVNVLKNHSHKGFVLVMFGENGTYSVTASNLTADVDEKQKVIRVFAAILR